MGRRASLIASREAAATPRLIHSGSIVTGCDRLVHVAAKSGEARLTSGRAAAMAETDGIGDGLSDGHDTGMRRRLSVVVSDTRSSSQSLRP